MKTDEMYPYIQFFKSL